MTQSHRINLIAPTSRAPINWGVVISFKGADCPPERTITVRAGHGFQPRKDATL